ncbi:MAG: hypothetical protein AAEJ47_03885 [Planctomycetota bacterium]
MIQTRTCGYSLLLLVLVMSVSVSAQDTWYGDQQGLWSYSGTATSPLADLSTNLRCLARTSSGGAWIAVDGQSLVFHIDPDGSIVQTIDTVVGVQALAVDEQGRAWGTRPGMDDVIVVEAGVGIVATHPVGSVPYGIAIDSDGRICVSCSYGNVVQVLSSDGQLINEINVGFFPTGICAAHDGGLWLAEKGGMRRLDSSGATVWTGLAGVFPIAVTTDLQGRAWFSCQNSHQVVVVGADGIENIVDVPARPLGISGNGDGSVTVLCRNGSSIVRVSPSGQIVDQVSAMYPLGTGDLNGLQYALIIDPEGDHDGDEVANALEAQLGFDPLDSSSCPVTFVRGDANRDGLVDFSDAITSLIILFGGASSSCLEALDVDDDGRLTLSDPIRILDHVLAAGPPPEAPYPLLGPYIEPETGFPCFP